MSRSFGVGQPLSFRCQACRSTVRDQDGRPGSINRVELTGRTRQRFTGTGGRYCAEACEYRCLDCGHVGWSRHVDLAEKAGAVPDFGGAYPRRRIPRKDIER